MYQLCEKLLLLFIFLGFPGGSGNKESSYNMRDLDSSTGLGRSPRGGHGNPFQYICLENPHGQRSLVGYRPLSHKESDRTEVTGQSVFEFPHHYHTLTNIIVFLCARRYASQFSLKNHIYTSQQVVTRILTLRVDSLGAKEEKGR